MAKANLTDRFVTSPPRVPRTGRTNYHDALVPGPALRVGAQCEAQRDGRHRTVQQHLRGGWSGSSGTGTL